MAKFFGRLSIFALLIAASNLLIIIITPVREDIYLLAFYDKLHLLETTESPKIILVSGSGAAYGMDSKRIKEETGYNVVNTGLALGMGLRFMLENVKPYIKSGDVVVLLSEYHQFSNFLNGHHTLLRILRLYPKGFFLINSIDQVYELIKNYPVFIKGHFNFLIKIARGKPVQIWARRYHFNEYGDFTENTKKWPEDISKKVLFRNEKQKIFNDDVIAVLNDFKDFADESGAKVYQLFPVIPKLHYHDSEVYIQYAYNRLAEESNIELLNKPEEFTLPLEYFFDEIYHVNNDGRQIYTGWVIERLKEVLEPPNTDMAITEK